MRICLDTNVLVAAFATRGLCSDVLRIVLAEHELVLGEVILAELRRILVRKLGLPADRIAVAEAVFRGVEIVPKPPRAGFPSIRDRDDRWVVATAVAGRADVLVTGDRDLLAVVVEVPMPILTPRAFWESLREGPAPGSLGPAG